MSRAGSDIPSSQTNSRIFFFFFFLMILSRIFCQKLNMDHALIMHRSTSREIIATGFPIGFLLCVYIILSKKQNERKEIFDMNNSSLINNLEFSLSAIHVNIYICMCKNMGK
jgi:hypothetical protein